MRMFDWEGGYIRKGGKGGEMKGSRQNKWKRSTANLCDELRGGCVHVIHQTSAADDDVTELKPGSDSTSTHN